MSHRHSDRDRAEHREREHRDDRNRPRPEGRSGAERDRDRERDRSERDRERERDRSERDGATPRPGGPPTSVRKNEYFVPKEGIDREVITADICRYLGQDALVRPGNYQVVLPSDSRSECGRMGLG